MDQLKGKVAWVTGAGSGIGEAATLALAAQGALVVLTGRRAEPLEAVARRIVDAGGRADVQAGDMMDSARVSAIAAHIERSHGRIDILINNAGLNIVKRSWAELTPEGVDDVVRANLSGAFYASLAVLPAMRRQQDGLLIHTSSWAGRFHSKVSGSVYAAAKHGVVAMSYSINLEEFRNGIRSTVICPAEVATPILDKRPVPVTAEERARLLQPEDLASSILHVALAPKHVCINEIVLSPTWNRSLA